MKPLLVTFLFAWAALNTGQSFAEDFKSSCKSGTKCKVTGLPKTLIIRILKSEYFKKVKTFKNPEELNEEVNAEVCHLTKRAIDKGEKIILHKQPYLEECFTSLNPLVVQNNEGGIKEISIDEISNYIFKGKWMFYYYANVTDYRLNFFPHYYTNGNWYSFHFFKKQQINDYLYLFYK